ncbi:hypothetical protein SETIT_7G309100v2 [Setaria italica]|uniref:Uncharacterized protein n=2 Tax=Setaria italica TaxID=4555 RepID=K3Y501_SETIT|nr:uncharacterized protein LOC101763463 isoform X1 [Setaria italica]RCV36318.1 hypothetical protein SETIT_7G309100v2 [Setaria italica]
MVAFPWRPKLSCRCLRWRPVLLRSPGQGIPEQKGLQLRAFPPSACFIPPSLSPSPRLPAPFPVTQSLPCLAAFPIHQPRPSPVTALVRGNSVRDSWPSPPPVVSSRKVSLYLYLRAEFMETKMPFDSNNLIFHIKRIVYPSIRLGYQSACDYPVVLGIGVLLLFLHKLCPSLFTFLLSSSPVFLLTALLLGALLSYGEPSAPVIEEETLENQKKSSPESKVSVTERSAEEVQNVAVTRAAKIFETPVFCIEERTSDILVHDSHRDEENVIYMSADTVLSAETSVLSKNEVIVEREEYVKEFCEEVELKQFESTTTERCHYEVNNQYQFGELMSACWEPVMRQEPCSDSESDLSDSSSDASITDIIPMLDELNLPVNLGTDHPSSTFRDNLNSSSDDDEDDSKEDGDLSSDEDRTEEEKADGNFWKDFMDPSSSDTEKNGNLESLMDRRKAKNILKFELDRRLMDMQAADAIQKMEEASRFRVQVPSISTPRRNPFDPSSGSEEIAELPKIPDSAPSVLLPWRKPFDISFDQIVDHGNRLQETWTPRSRFPSTQRRKHENLYLKQSTYLRHHNGTKPEKPEVSEKDASDNHSYNNSEQAWNNGKLFGSLEPHVGDEIKILSAAISDVCVLEVNEGTKSTDPVIGTDSFYIQKSISSTSKANDLVSAGCEQLLLCSLSEEYNTEKHIVEADSISEVNSLFKCRMEEVLVQSISESGIDQPLTGKLEHELNGTLCTESAMPAIEARSVEELNSQFVQLSGEALECATSDSSCDDEHIQDRSSEALPVENGHTSELPKKDCHSYPTPDNPVAVNVKCKSKELLTEDTELPVLEACSVEEMNSLFRQLEDEAPAQMPHSSDLMVGEHNGDIDSGVLVPDANSSEGIGSAFVHLSNDDEKIKIPGDGEVILGSVELNSGLHVMETNALNGDDTSGFDST